MKKILIFVLASFMLLSTSCMKTFKCEIKYQMVYSDTTYVRSYEFDGNQDATYRIFDYGNDGKVLTVFPTGNLGDIIARVPSGNDNIIVTDFKTFRYGIDIPYRGHEND